VKPVLVLQNLCTDGPAYLASWLQARGIAFEVCNADAGQAFPPSMAGYGALAILGGEMSANDDLASLRQAEALVRQAVLQGLPTIGHCLGGQLMARALGAPVRPAAVPEIGWSTVNLVDSDEARAWFGDTGPATVFQWHHDTFDLPPGGQRVAHSAACAHQAFALGPHLTMQFHIEVDAQKLAAWCEAADAHPESTPAGHATVQDAARMRAGTGLHLGASQALADRIYGHWWRLAAASA
jgi:GMP synthase (glutamine-hydrolysing)